MGPLCPNNLSGNSLWKHSMKILKDEFRFFKIHNYIAATLTNAGKVAHIRLCNLSNKHLYFIPCCFIYTIVLGIVHFLCFSGKFDGKTWVFTAGQAILSVWHAQTKDRTEAQQTVNPGEIQDNVYSALTTTMLITIGAMLLLWGESKQSFITAPVQQALTELGRGTFKYAAPSAWNGLQNQMNLRKLFTII